MDKMYGKKIFCSDIIQKDSQLYTGRDAPPIRDVGKTKKIEVR